MNQAGHDITKDPTDISDGIANGTKIIIQVIRGSEIWLKESANADDNVKPNRLKGDPDFEYAEYTIGDDPIWAYKLDSGKSELAVAY